MDDVKVEFMQREIDFLKYLTIDGFEFEIGKYNINE